MYLLKWEFMVCYILGLKATFQEDPHKLSLMATPHRQQVFLLVSYRALSSGHSSSSLPWTLWLMSVSPSILGLSFMQTTFGLHTHKVSSGQSSTVKWCQHPCWLDWFHSTHLKPILVCTCRQHVSRRGNSWACSIAIFPSCCQEGSVQTVQIYALFCPC